MTTMRVVGECFFWYLLTRVFPDKFHRAVKRLCVCVCVCKYKLNSFLSHNCYETAMCTPFICQLGQNRFHTDILSTFGEKYSNNVLKITKLAAFCLAFDRQTHEQTERWWQLCNCVIKTEQQKQNLQLKLTTSTTTTVLQLSGFCLGLTRWASNRKIKPKPIWISWSKRQSVAVGSAGPYANLHLDTVR